ncbi:MAG: hypothetical protein WBR10_00535, partial [Candidatus Acidiferrum sp.]
NPGECLRSEASRDDCELEGSGGDIGKGELPTLVRYHLLVWGLIFACQSHPGSDDDSPGSIDNSSADAAGQLLVGQPLSG